ncbi:MAG: hypothetical protein E6K92_00295 [Thaumarchaeota archaeon]|nr:MAG: hypothetical protein E6K92_00295 [Nitrososphaerota archaeon]
MNSCRGVCDKYKVKKKQRGSYYEEGFKHCPTCELFIKWDGVVCPCCHVKLRHPRRVLLLGGHTLSYLLYLFDSCFTMENDDAPSDLLKLLDQDEKLLLYMKQKKYRPSINIESVAITDRRVIFRKPSMLTIKKSFTDYSYADILNVTIDKGPLRSTLNLNLRLDGSDLLVDDIPNDEAQEAFKLIRQGIDNARSKFTV